MDVFAANAVANEVNLRCFSFFFRKIIVKTMGQELDRRSCAQIRTADTDYQQDIGILLNLLRSFFDASELFLIIVHRKVDPSKKIIARAGLFYQRLSCRLHARLDTGDLFLMNKCSCF